MSEQLPQRKSWPALAVLLGLSTLLKLALLVPAAGLPLRADERQYVAGAVAIATTGVPVYPNPVWDEAHSSPLYPYGLALVYLVVGEGGFRTAARAMQVLLSTLTVLVIYLVAARAFDRRNALISAGVTAFFPTFIAYSHYFYTETLYTVLFVAIGGVLLCGVRPLSLRRVFAAGIVGGLAALTRSGFIVQAPFVLLWLLFAGGAPLRRRALAAAFFALGMVAAIAPWSVRNAVRYERFLLIDTNGGNVLHKNWNAIRQENHDIGMDKRWRDDRQSYEGAIPFRERVEIDEPIARNSAEIRAAVRFTLRHPALFLRQSLIRAEELVNPTSFLVRAIRLGDYALPPIAAETLVWSVLVSTMALLAFGAFGLSALRPSNTAATLPALLICSNVVVCVAIVSMSRYRYPMMPLLVPFAVDGLVRLPRLAAQRPRAFWAALATVGAMAVAWVRYVPYSL